MSFAVARPSTDWLDSLRSGIEHDSVKEVCSAFKVDVTRLASSSEMSEIIEHASQELSFNALRFLRANGFIANDVFNNFHPKCELRRPEVVANDKLRVKALLHAAQSKKRSVAYRALGLLVMEDLMLVSEFIGREVTVEGFLNCRPKTKEWKAEGLIGTIAFGSLHEFS
jgi:hypothetical protein